MCLYTLLGSKFHNGRDESICWPCFAGNALQVQKNKSHHKLEWSKPLFLSQSVYSCAPSLSNVLSFPRGVPRCASLLPAVSPNSSLKLRRRRVPPTYGRHKGRCGLFSRGRWTAVKGPQGSLLSPHSLVSLLCHLYSSQP